MRGNANTYTHPDSKSYADSYFYSNSHSNSNLHANSNGHRNSDTEVSSHAAAPSDSTAVRKLPAHTCYSARSLVISTESRKWSEWDERHGRLRSAGSCERVGRKSFKASMQTLDRSLRNIADQHLHSPIRSSETLRNARQVDFGNDLD